MRRTSIIICLTTLLFAANEPSAFEAGDLNSPHPYGLTPTEKKIYQNTQAIKQLQKNLFSLQERVDSLDEKIDGIKSIVEGLDENINKLKKERQQENEENETQSVIAQLRNDLNATIEEQKRNFDQFKKVLKEMSKLIDHINATYVSKQELKSELEKIYSLLEKKQTEKKSGAQLYKEARVAYKKGEYNKASELFELAAKKGYKPAASSFYLGESCYYQKRYDCAIEAYKKSASLYQNASYMPTLLLHTAVSLEKLGEKQEAKKFYDSVVKLYPKSKSAKIAKKKLKKL